MTLISLPPLPHFSKRFYEKDYFLEAKEDAQQRSGRNQEVDEAKSFGDGTSGTPGVDSLPNGVVYESLLLVRDGPLVAGEHKKLWLANGGYTLVDADLYEDSASHNWRKYDNGNGNIYVSRYQIIEGKKLKIYLHRQITGAKKGEFVDHKNGYGLDNSCKNLRLTNYRGNSWNRGKNKTFRKRTTSSLYKGVTWDRSCSRWKARIMVDGIRINLGLFEKDKDAARAYDGAAIEHFEELAHTNFEYDEPLFLEDVA